MSEQGDKLHIPLEYPYNSLYWQSLLAHIDWSKDSIVVEFASADKEQDKEKRSDGEAGE